MFWRYLAVLVVFVLPVCGWAYRTILRFRAGDQKIAKLIKPPVDCGFGKHDEAQEQAARKRREQAGSLALDAARARLPRRLVMLDEHSVSQFRARR